MKPKYMKLLTLFTGILVLILDAKTAFAGAASGIDLCIRVVIPSLFPFFVLSMLLTSTLAQVRLPFLQSFGKLLRLSDSGSAVWIAGLLGGYPVGAQCLATALDQKNISGVEANRLIAFCNNAGPAFLFGIGMLLFEDIKLCFLSWGIQLLSSMAVAFITPGEVMPMRNKYSPPAVSLPAALKRSVETMALVCGWVVVFRVILAVLSRWVLWLLPQTGRILVFGLLELSNGCSLLTEAEPMGLRILLFNVFLSFGGLCVTMQTFSVLTGCSIDTAPYLTGKSLQTVITFLLCALCQCTFPAPDKAQGMLLPLILGISWIFIYCIFFRNKTKTSRNPLSLGV